MDKLTKIAVIAALLMGSVATAFGQSYATKGDPGYYEVTILYTWENCATNGRVYVDAFWSSNQTGSGWKDYNSPGDVLEIPTPWYGGSITKTRVSVVAFDAQYNGSPPNVYEWDYYMPTPNVAPSPCKFSNGWRRYSNGGSTGN